jgi:hypothetical protein
MSQKPNVPLPQASSLGDFTPATGFTQKQTVSNYRTQSGPINNPTQLIGVDVVAFNTGQQSTVTFINLPVRDVTNNPVAPTQNAPQTITLNPGDVGIFTVFVQGALGAVASPVVTDSNNTRTTSSFLGPGVYKSFGAQISSSSPTHGTVVGTLYLQRANQ